MEPAPPGEDASALLISDEGLRILLGVGVQVGTFIEVVDVLKRADGTGEGQFDDAWLLSDCRSD